MWGIIGYRLLGDGDKEILGGYDFNFKIGYKKLLE